jgi:hypothetical protein
MNKWARKQREDFEARLMSERIAFEYIPEGILSAELKDKWLENFATGISKKGIHIEQFLWHIFSFERQICAVGQEADRCFSVQTKGMCHIFFQHQDDCYFLSDAAGLTPEDLSIFFDVYVIAGRLNWTYVKTHESDCGPYFYHKKMNA